MNTLRDLYDLLTADEQNGLLEGYVEAQSDGLRRTSETTEERIIAERIMFDNCEDSLEIRRDHVNYCLVEIAKGV